MEFDRFAFTVIVENNKKGCERCLIASNPLFYGMQIIAH